MGRSSGCPDASIKLSVPDAAWPAVPLNRMNCVDHPPESTICGKNVSSVVDAAVSLAGGVVVIFSLLRRICGQSKGLCAHK